ncbi:hypothetical protein EQM14_00675 [Caproiciproducens sp. NJN-50]|uniref:hypothetical protein n=1 Tax=Acutalibacteraceae TaxID=3082771 RepID=UPI000FFE1BB4|nr:MULTISPECIES: hypothetical protein [Acutalibacteraceae]QAT48412.1 hypothetical protein EQM14_00675 [Caproiciproducens sp. NJN-50]
MAREGLLIHGDGEYPEPQSPTPDTPRKKWENFWYYHKWHALVLLAAAVFLIFLARDLTRPGADYEIGLVTANGFPQEAVGLLEKNIAKCGEDLNGDGRVTVQIDSYAAGAENGGSGIQAANQVKLEADLSAGDCMLFLTDADSFSQQQSKLGMFARTDGSTPEAGESGPGGMRIPLSGLKALAGLSYRTAEGENLMERLGLSLRVYRDTAVDGKKDAYWNASRRLFQKLASG